MEILSIFTHESNTFLFKKYTQKCHSNRWGEKPRNRRVSLFQHPGSLCTTSVQVFFGLPLGLATSTSHSIHSFKSLSSFRSTCPYHRNLFCCSTEIISSNPSLSLNPLHGILYFTLTPHIHLTILICDRWSATSFSYLAGQVSLPYIKLLRTQLPYNLPLSINDISLLVSNGTNCLIYSTQFEFWPPQLHQIGLSRV